MESQRASGPRTTVHGPISAGGIPMPGCRLDSAWVAVLPKRDLELIASWVWASFCFGFFFFFCKQNKWYTGLHWEECSQQIRGSCCPPLFSAGEVSLEYFVRYWGSYPLPRSRRMCGNWSVLRSWWGWEAEMVRAWRVSPTRGTWRELGLFGLKRKGKGVILTGACKNLKGSYEDDRAELSLIAANNTARGSGHKL